ncbi:MAG: hypothetical protein ACK5KU_09070 [Beutenbergiaceae bacterium]
MNQVVAMKCYGFEWLTDLNLSTTGAAALMASHGVDWALLQNTIDPLPSSGVPQQIPADRYDDQRFRDAVRAEGMKVFESTAIFFDPLAYRTRPELRPVGSDGVTMAPYDWYYGISPHDSDYLNSRAERLEEVVATYQPDGVFLSFIRFPGFWEALTAQVDRHAVTDYGFAHGALERFENDTAHVLPRGGIATKAAVILRELRSEWTAWKCQLVVDSIATLREAVNRARPGTEVLINGLAFPAQERGPLGQEVFGHDYRAISQVAEHIETMVYHQILGRPVRPWIEEVVADLRPQVSGTLLACLQTSAAYTEPPHDGLGRAQELPAQEFVEALKVVAQSEADGVSIYHWTDIAAEELYGTGAMANALRRFKDGTLL